MCCAEAVQTSRVVKNSDSFSVMSSKKKKQTQQWGSAEQGAVGSDTELIKNEKMMTGGGRSALQDKHKTTSTWENRADWIYKPLQVWSSVKIPVDNCTYQCILNIYVSAHVGVCWLGVRVHTHVPPPLSLACPLSSCLWSSNHGTSNQQHVE